MEMKGLAWLRMGSRWRVPSYLFPEQWFRSILRQAERGALAMRIFNALGMLWDEPVL
jgi:hypothetical protein